MPAQSKQPFTSSVDANYASRDNIVVPTVTLGRSAAQVATNAVVELNQRFRSTVDTDVAISNIDTPGSVAA